MGDSLSAVEANLAGAKDGISERFVPDQDPGRLIEVEHISRYRWAAQAARGCRVLDAGCGAAYGSRLLAAGGAQTVLGVDIAESVLNAVAPSMPDSVTLAPGDLRQLDLPDDSFDLVVCFEVIEHFEDPLTVLEELVRVLAPNGLLLTSSPNRGVYQSGNPHHFHEFKPEELESALASRLKNARLMRQHDYVVSAVLSDATYAQGAGTAVQDVQLFKLVAGEPGEEVYTVAMASDAPLPEIPQLAAMTGTLELREWLSTFDVQTAAITDKDNYIAELEARIAERDRLSELLVDAEQRLADVPNLQLRIADLEFELAEARRETESAREQARQLDERLMLGEQVLLDVFRSPSWQLTKPLRSAKKLLR